MCKLLQCVRVIYLLFNELACYEFCRRVTRRGRCMETVSFMWIMLVTGVVADVIVHLHCLAFDILYYLY